MSNLDIRRRQLPPPEERANPLPVRRLGRIAVLLAVLFAGITVAAELHWLPTYSVDDVGSVLFGNG